ncbi:MAG: DUF1553 domain-containing protein [Verrucomicrobiales bacterium]|nr:DUF1553 domain-containing protein [Verrucomicrobiales bacterium]
MKPPASSIFLPFRSVVVAGSALVGLAGSGDALGAGRDAADHWSFQPIARPPIPVVQAAERVANPIDAFVLAALERDGLGLSPEADPATLLRRLSLDLTGLIPSAEETRQFLSAWSDDPASAWRAAVDRALDSPHFGEHWGRHWLDMARYADSEGYLGDSERPWAWIYRDWVIDAINRDLPHDQFSIEQLAGDLLEKPTLEQRIATGFHRNTLRNTEAGVDLELYRTKEIVDRVNTTGTVWLGLTIGCAECHDHKHDPLSQADFFRLYAFFNNADEVTANVPMTPELTRYAESLLTEKDRKKDPKPTLAARAAVFSERTQSRRESYIHLRGDYQSRGDNVQPGTPAVLPPLSAGSGDADRLDLARWLFDEKNPLTARVAANQVWLHLFGEGLVPTPDDFGTEGAAPTHPELLDWLASEYRRLGWSRKELIRLITQSSAYRQRSDVRDGLADHATGNALLWRQNRFRVPAEAVRDIHLAASGLLDRRLGGPGIRPPLPAFVTEVGRTVAWPVSEGGDRYRRGCYILLKRTVLYPMLTAFDAPDTSLSCSRRDRTESPMQALTLLNDPVFFECSETLGRDLHRVHGADVDAAIDSLFLRCLNRPPTAAEADTLRSAHRDLFRESGGDAALALAATARVVLNLDEFITRN